MLAIGWLDVTPEGVEYNKQDIQEIHGHFFTDPRMWLGMDLFFYFNSFYR